MRWKDPIVKLAGKTWKRDAQDRELCGAIASVETVFCTYLLMRSRVHQGNQGKGNNEEVKNVIGYT